MTVFRLGNAGSAWRHFTNDQPDSRKPMLPNVKNHQSYTTNGIEPQSICIDRILYTNGDCTLPIRKPQPTQ